MTASEKLAVMLGQLSSIAFSPGSMFSLYSLLTAFCVGVGFLGFRQWSRRGRVRPAVLARAIFARRLVWNRSTLADVGFFFLNCFAIGALIGWALIEGNAVGKAVLYGLKGHLGAVAPSQSPDLLLRAGMTLTLFLAYEFSYWLDHYLKHRIPFLWEMHRTHHTAETLTPWTMWRVHPLDTLVFSNIQALFIGCAAGVATYLMGKDDPAFLVDGGNVILVFFIYACVHLQHSQFWIPFTGTAGRLFMSPAHHQIHHSLDPAHHNSNLGSCLAVCDWLFGTLVVPSKESPNLKYGVAPRAEDPHSIHELLVAPMVNCLAFLSPKPAEAPARIVVRDK
jgi:sterol desaturase/sphingolipid hydroxylase (fatty acid hydroxylase superfamily)